MMLGAEAYQICHDNALKTCLILNRVKKSDDWTLNNTSCMLKSNCRKYDKNKIWEISGNIFKRFCESRDPSLAVPADNQD